MELTSVPHPSPPSVIPTPTVCAFRWWLGRLRENGGTPQHAQQIAAHESPRTTKLYDRTTDQVSLDEIERIAI